MNSIESLRLDFDSQTRELARINNSKLFNDCIFVGSGDSYIAGLIVEFITGHKCLCYSPSDLLYSGFIQDKTYCFISVTGRTRANISIARRATESGVNTIAVTMNKDSSLAQVCKEIVPIEIKRTKAPTGFGTFAANVLTCLQIIGISVPHHFDIWHKHGTELSQKVLNYCTLPSGTVYILGNSMLYPLALYSSLQMAEFFGTTAIAHKLEEFCHSPIFGLKKSHHIWILGQNEENVYQKLCRLGRRQLSYFELYNQDIVSQIFESIFFVQNLILLLAEKHRYTELRYVMMKDVLKVSSDIIYSEEIE
jgi:fructoselysine-6-P-deglycase FrlB-like protein